MKKLYLIVTLLCLATFAQAQDEPDTPRAIWCQMQQVTEPNVAEFVEYCGKLLEVYPSPKEIAGNEIKRKLFLNRMHGCIKRGAEYDRLTPKQRTDLADLAVKYLDEYLGWREMKEWKQPEGFQRKNMGEGETCEQKELDYADAAACRADCDHIYVECVSGSDLSTVAFWCVLNRMACVLDCDSAE